MRCDGSAQPEFINRQADWHWGMSQQAAGLRRSSDCSSGAGGGIAGSEGVDAVVTPRSVLPLAVDSWSETLAGEYTKRPMMCVYSQPFLYAHIYSCPPRRVDMCLLLL